MAGSTAGSSLSLDQHVILFKLCCMTESNSLNSVEDRGLSSRCHFVLLFVCILGIHDKFQEGKELARFYGILASLTATYVSLRLAQYLPIYEQQFSKPQQKDGLTLDGHSDAFNFSTGRRNIASLHTIFAMRPRHDFFQLAFQIGRTFVDLQYRPRDDLQLDFKLSPGVLNESFVFAIVAKDELISVKDGRWDLVRILTLTS